MYNTRLCGVHTWTNAVDGVVVVVVRWTRLDKRTYKRHVVFLVLTFIRAVSRQHCDESKQTRRTGVEEKRLSINITAGFTDEERGCFLRSHSQRV